SYTGRGLMADDKYLQALSLQLGKGRFFSTAYATATLSLILNESAITAMGIKGNPVGARLTSPDDQFNARDGAQYIYTVAGVVKDFHFQNLHEKIAPLFIINVRKMTPIDPLMVVKLDAANYPVAISSIEKVWKK